MPSWLVQLKCDCLTGKEDAMSRGNTAGIDSTIEYVQVWGVKIFLGLVRMFTGLGSGGVRIFWVLITARS